MWNTVVNQVIGRQFAEIPGAHGYHLGHHFTLSFMVDGFDQRIWKIIFPTCYNSDFFYHPKPPLSELIVGDWSKNLLSSIVFRFLIRIRRRQRIENWRMQTEYLSMSLRSVLFKIDPAGYRLEEATARREDQTPIVWSASGGFVIKIRSSDSLPAFVATSAEQACSILYLNWSLDSEARDGQNTLFDVGRSMLDVH